MRAEAHRVPLCVSAPSSLMRGILKTGAPSRRTQVWTKTIYSDRDTLPRGRVGRLLGAVRGHA